MPRGVSKRRHRPIPDSVCFAFVDVAELRNSPEKAERLAAGITEQQLAAIHQLLARRKQESVSLQFFIEIVDRRDQLLRNLQRDGIRGFSQ